MVFWDFLQFWPFLGANKGSKLLQKYKLWVPLIPVKIQIFQRLLWHCFTLLEYYLCWTYQQNWTIYGGKISNPPPKKRGAGMYVPLIWKSLKLWNLATTNAILMKLIMIMYICKIFHLAENWDIKHRAPEGMNKKKKITFLA